MSTPCSAPLPVATMIDSGVAKPSAQGHAMIRTATAATNPRVTAGLGPKSNQITNVAIAMKMTTGTNTRETESARRWIGAFDPWACWTSRMI